jgi:hypothetical protein
VATTAAKDRVGGVDERGGADDGEGDDEDGDRGDGEGVELGGLDDDEAIRRIGRTAALGFDRLDAAIARPSLAH